jgi:hypothetical protein
MNKLQLKELLLSWTPKWRARKATEVPEVLDMLNAMYPRVHINSQIYCFLNEKSPYCIICKCPLTDYRKTSCSIECRSKSTDHTSRILKQKKTLRELYGVENIRNIPGAETKRKDTMINKYGMLVSPKTVKKAKDRAPALQQKGKATLLKRYGVENPGQLPDHRNKCIATMLQSSGVDHFMKSPEKQQELYEKRIQTYNDLCPDYVTLLAVEEPAIDTTFKDPNYRIIFTCNRCMTTENLPSETFRFRIRETGTCCFKCSGIKKGSIKENALRMKIEEHHECVSNCRNIIPNAEIDIYLPSVKIGVEFNGLYWHSNLFLPSDYHYKKYKLGQKHNVTIIQIFEDEWEYNRDAVLNTIFRYSYTSSNQESLAASKISTEAAKAFLLNTSLIDDTGNDYIGIFKHGILAGVLSFTEDKNTINIVNFGTTANYIDILNAGLDILKNKNIVFYDDNRFSIGNHLKNIGFSIDNFIDPRRWYVDTKSIKRSSVKISDTTVFDCGSTKWIWNKNKGA